MKLHVWLAAFFTLIFYAGGAGLVGAEEKTLVLAVEDCLSSKAKVKRYFSFGNYLVGELPGFTRLAIKFPKHTGELDDWIQKGEVHLVITKLQRLIAWQSNNLKITPLASLVNSDGSTNFTGIFISRKDSNIKTFADMKGKSILFGAKGDFEKNEAAIYTLMQNGIHSKDYFKEIAHGTICPLIGKQVYDARYDVGLTSDYSWGDILESRRVDLNEMQIISRTISIPYLTLFGSNLSTKEMDIVAQRSTALNNQDVLTKLQCSKLKKFDHADLTFLLDIEKKITNWE